MIENNAARPASSEPWRQALESLSAAPIESWNATFAQAENLVLDRSETISESAIDDDERLDLLHASAKLFQAKVAKWGYGPATRACTGPASASDDLRRRGLADAQGKDIENVT
jgi:hypothetical protein